MQVTGKSQAKFLFVPAIKNKKTRKPQANPTGSALAVGWQSCPKKASEILAPKKFSQSKLTLNHH